MSEELKVQESIRDEQLETLRKEYELALARSEGLDNRILEILGVGLGIFSLVSGYVINQQTNLPLIAAWFAPMIYLTVFALLITTVYYAVASIFEARLITKRINSILGVYALIRFDPEMPEALFFSNRHGSYKFRLLYFMLFFGSVALFLITLGITFVVIYQNSHFVGFIFLLIYCSLAALMLFSTSGLYYDLPDIFESYIKQGEMAKAEFLRKSIAYKSLSTLFVSIIPRSWDFFAKAPFMLYGLVAAFLINGIDSSRLNIINALFSSGQEWKNINEVPLWSIVALGLVYFIIEELFLQQAKYIWNDIRDRSRDGQLLQNNTRAIVSNKLPLSSAYWQISVRLVAAFVFGYIVGGYLLTVIFFVIAIHQFFYELAIKPYASRLPNAFIILLYLSFGALLRFIAGVVSFSDGNWSLLPIILLSTVFYFGSFGALSALWKMESKWIMRIHGLKNLVDLPTARAQSEFYRKYGNTLQHVGLIAAVLMTLCLMLQSQIGGVLCGVSTNGVINLCETNPYGEFYKVNVLAAIALVGLIIISIMTISFIIVVALRFLGGLVVLEFTLVSAYAFYVSNICGSFIESNASVCFFKPNVSLNAVIQEPYVVVAFSLITVILSIMLRRQFLLFIRAIKSIVVTLSFLAALIAGILSLAYKDGFLFFGAFLALNIGYLFLYEDMTYEEFTLYTLRRKLPYVIFVWNIYLFTPNPLVNFRVVMLVTLYDFDPDKLDSIKSEDIREVLGEVINSYNIWKNRKEKMLSS